MNEVTRLLQSVRAGRPGATDELRRLAAHRLSQESAAHTLPPTALVHVVYLRLVGADAPGWENRAHFFAAAAEAMRRILIEAARGKQRLKRAGGHRFELSESDRIGLPIADELLDLNEALARLEKEQPDKAQVVKLKFFAGMTIAEIATALALSTATVERHWAYARAWLHQELQKEMREIVGRRRMS